MSFDLMLLRCRLLLRQKIGWVSLLAGLALILIGYSTSTVSFVAPAKIFWDFALGLSFVLVHVLGIYLAVQLFQDEKDRRTLHLILVSGVSRTHWIVANALGIWMGLMAIDMVWFGSSWAVAALALGDLQSSPILVQVKILQAFSLLIVISFSILFSMLLRPLLALFAAASLSVFLYSVSSIERVFSDPQTAAYIESNWALGVLKVSKVLPPLEWFDVKMFVGYEAAVSWNMVGLASALGVAWAVILLTLASWRFSKLDL